jgi:hypothetical protein
MKLFVKVFLLFTLLIWLVPVSASALPYIPGCPLHESCVRAFKQEQRQRQREQRQRESPDAAWEDDETEEGEDGEKVPVKKPLGIIVGFQMDLGDWNDKRNDYINLRPSIAYMNGFGNLDIFASAFYTLSLDDPGLSPVKKNEKLRTMSRGGIQQNIAYTFDLSERFTLAPGLDNQNQFDFTPDVDSLYSNGRVLAYSVLEPSLRIGCDIEIGDLNLTNSLPFSYTDDLALDYTISLSLNLLLGFGITLTGQFWDLWVDPDSEYGQIDPEFKYGETELVLTYWRGPFFASLAMTADSDFKQFSIEPYVSYRIKKLSFFVSVLFCNLGDAGTEDEIRLNAIQGKRDVSGVIPSIGVKYRF